VEECKLQVNIDDTHWVGVVIDAAQSLFLYGDSIAGSNTELKSAIDWWIENHTSQQFVHQNLLITRQFDGYNCSIFAVNAVGCNALPEHISLLETSTHANEL
jgi:Ulp1 family protease